MKLHKYISVHPSQEEEFTEQIIKSSIHQMINEMSEEDLAEIFSTTIIDKKSMSKLIKQIDDDDGDIASTARRIAQDIDYLSFGVIVKTRS